MQDQDVEKLLVKAIQETIQPGIKEYLNQALALLRSKPKAGELTGRIRREYASMFAGTTGKYYQRVRNKDLESLCDLLDASNEERDKLKEEMKKVWRCPCGGEFEGEGYYQYPAPTVSFRCKKCKSELNIPQKIWYEAIGLSKQYEQALKEPKKQSKPESKGSTMWEHLH